MNHEKKVKRLVEIEEEIGTTREARKNLGVVLKGLEAERKEIIQSLKEAE